jgi:hypothetical protein
LAAQLIEKFLVRGLCKTIDVVRRESTTAPLAEDLYRHFFVRDLARLDIADDFYPIGNAANFGLMYLLTRLLAEFPLSRIVEFGAGQTTILLDRLGARVGRNLEITTIEQDAFWAGTIGRQVHHDVLNVALTATQVDGRTVHFYDLPPRPALQQPDLVIVDGPVAYVKGSYFDRTGAAPYLKEHLGDEFVVVIDDAERLGESTLARLVRDDLAARGVAFYENTIKAAKQQRLFCTERYRSAAYY